MKLPGWGQKNTHKKKPSNLPANLQDDTQKFQVIFENFAEGVMLIDTQGTIQLINPAAATICGWKAEDATNINFQAVLQILDEKGKPVNESDSLITQVIKTGQAQRSDSAVLLKQDKSQVAITLNVSPLLSDDNQVTAVVAVLNNVTKERAEQQQRADFISTASHEMRTPVAAIEGYLALALNNKVATIDDRAHDYLEKAHASTQHLGKLFQDLLTSAKAEDGRLTSHPSVIELGEFLENLSNDLRLVAEKKGLFMEFTAGTSGGTINATRVLGGEKKIRPLYYAYVDPDRFREVITNLFDNAVKYTQEGRITIGLTGDEQIVQCYVKDTGTGIPPDDVSHLFQKFYRVDNSSTRTVGGTGLGLFICRKIVELYDGRIWVESKLGEGSTFFINLPRVSTQKINEIQNNDTNPQGIKQVSTDTTP